MSLTNFQLANQSLVKKEYRKAVSLYVRHAEECPEEAAKAYAGAAECCLRSNVLSETIPVEAGITLVSQGDRQGAEYYFRLALRSDPGNLRALWGLSELLPNGAGERLDLLKRAVAKQPSTISLIALGDFLRTHRKDFEKAYEIYCEACDHNPKDQTAYLRLNDICRRMGRDDEARSWSEKWTAAYATKRRVDGKGT